MERLDPKGRAARSNNSMAQEREIAARITSLNELLQIVAAIRAMAASQMQQALRSLEAIRGYSEQIREALSEAATLLPAADAIEAAPRPKKSALVVFCAEHGLCGGFNEHPLRAAERAAKASEGGLALIVVGTRGAQICRERGLNPDLVLPMATHCAGVTGTARRVHQNCIGCSARAASMASRSSTPNLPGANCRTSSSIACCRSRCR